METHCLERKEHCDHRFDDMRKLICVQFNALEKAIVLARAELEKDVTLARKEMERRLEGMNEFRAQLEKQAGSFLSREYYDSEHKSLSSEIKILREWKAKLEGARGWSNILSAMAVLISIVVGIINYTK